MSQLNESDLDSVEEKTETSESDSDFEIQLKSAKRKGTVSQGTVPSKKFRHKAASRSASSSNQSDTQQTTPHLTPLRKITRQTTHNERKETTAGQMYEAVKAGRSALVTVIDEWLDDYKRDREAGLLELINFVVHCCGCKGIVTKEMFNNLQNADIISQLTKEFNEDSVTYPLSSVGPQWRRFRSGLCEFVALLVRRCQNSLLYDEFLFSSLLALLIGLADSQVRAFRHTSTLIVMKLMSAVVEVAAVVFAQAEMTRRRSELEKNKKAELRATERVEELQASYQELLEHQEELFSMINSVFKGVFVHRYRDNVPEIRTICMEEIGLWLREYPTYFLSDGHLKYLGWMLHDKQAPVRLQCVLALQRLYQEKDFIGRLELFTSRFRERMVNMVLDKDFDVAVEAIKLLLLVQERTEDGLSEEECSHVYPLVFATHGGLAAAAGEFLYYQLYREVNQVLTEEGSDKRRITFLNLLTCFFIQSKYHEHGAYLVDSLWTVAGTELRDWDMMTSLLLHDKGDGQGLEDEEEGALVELMICAVRQASEATPPVARAQGKRNLSMKDKKVQAQDRRRLTNHFIPLLPQLLSKYSADADKVSCLLRAPLYFDLKAYGSTGRLEKYLEQLMIQLCGIVEKHTDECVLEACARVACVLCEDTYTFSVRMQRAVSQLLDRTVECFTSLLDELLQGTADEDELFSAAASLKRIAAFSSARDMTTLKVFESCLMLLKCGVESREVEKELMVPALRCAGFHLLWEKVKITNTNTQTSKAELKRLRGEVHSFCVLCQNCLSLGQAEIRDQAFVLLCDLLIIFSDGSVRVRPELQAVVYAPDDSVRAEMASFVLDYVFSQPEDEIIYEAEMKLALLQRRRNQLAGYCKLILYGVLEIRAAADVLKYYSKFYRDYGDIIKETLSKLKMISQVESAKTVGLCLQQVSKSAYTCTPPCVCVVDRLCEMFSDRDEQHHAEEMKEIKELAKRLSMSFGINLHRIRKPLLALHQDGLRFAFGRAEQQIHPPPNLAFLEILSEFSYKLVRQDRTQLLGYLQHVRGSITGECVKMYERSLHSGTRGSPALSLQGTPAKKRRKTMAQGSVLSVDEGSQLAGSVLSSLPTPTLTSTAHVERLPRPASPSVVSPRSYHEPSSEHDSVDDFTKGSLRRKVNATRKQHISSERSEPDIDSQLNMLSLIEEYHEEEEDEVEEEAMFEEFEENDDSDFETGYSLPSTRRCSSYLEDLFE
ncbi:cohesin subunit SA-1 [Chanos chanos]|uniref:Cohesin subunit SA n=1 Tax=Chanos chanos TaxID=29144 RepID=A0A6J2ULP4_CHACN|nr:cohesin subunit SA-1-like [Chanos chanos]